jgi:hypothetical protein
MWLPLNLLTFERRTQPRVRQEEDVTHASR